MPNAILREIESIKALCPDLRIGQILDNAITTYPKTKGLDLFYVGDKELLQALRHYVNFSLHKTGENT